MRRALAAVIVVVGCGGGAPPPPRPLPAPPAPARDPDLVRMPDDVWAIGAVDLAQLRESTARRWLWELLEERSPVIRRCRDVIAAGTRATIGLREEDKRRDRSTSVTYAVVHGIDRAAMTACLHAKIVDALPALPPNHEACDGYDAQVHELSMCGVIARSSYGVLKDIEATLGETGPGACPDAAKAVAAANARRTQLGWACRGDRMHDAEVMRLFAKVSDVDADTVALGDFERVHFVDATTIEIGSAETLGAGDVLADLKPSAKRRWFESSADTLDRTHGAWVVADLTKEIKEPVAIAASVIVRGDASIDLQIANPPAKLTIEAMTIAGRFLADPLAAGVKVELGCLPVVTPARTPKYLACEAAEDHLQTLEATSAMDVRGLLDERAQRCVADNWPADYIGCLGGTKTVLDYDRCYQTLSATDRERIESGETSACGKRAFHVHVAIPDGRIEAIKLDEALSKRIRSDCLPPIAGIPTEVSFGLTGDDARAAMACFPDAEGAPQCSMVAFENKPATWSDTSDMRPSGECIGPFIAQTGFGIESKNGNCGFAQPPHVTIALTLKGLDVCNEKKACAHLARPDAMAIDTGGTFVVARVGRSVEVWDVASAKRTAAIAVDPTCGSVSIAGELLAVDCGAKSFLANRRGARIATLGDVVMQPLPLATGVWGFVTRRGETLVGYDGKTGKETSRIELGLSADAVAASGDGDGRVAIAYGVGKDSGTIAIVERGGVRAFKEDACPAGRSPR